MQNATRSAGRNCSVCSVRRSTRFVLPFFASLAAMLLISAACPTPLLSQELSTSVAKELFGVNPGLPAIRSTTHRGQLTLGGRTPETPQPQGIQVPAPIGSPPSQGLRAASQLILAQPIPQQGIVVHEHSSADSASSCMTLGGHQIGCLASQQWAPADILRQRGRTLIQLYCEEDQEQLCAAKALAHFLNMMAEHQEDIGAASALRAYYTRIALAEQLRLMHESLAYIATEEAKQVEAQREGLPALSDLSNFERLTIGIQDDQLQLLAKDRQLRCLLAQLTGVDYASDQVCQEHLDVLVCTLDCERLKQLALHLRSDLRGWQYLLCHVNEDSAPIFAQMLATIVGNWGLPIPKVAGLKAVLCPPDYSCLAANMRYEISLTVETHRKWICQAVEEKCEALRLAYARIELAQRVIASWQSRVAQLELLDTKGESAPEELAIARSELLEARAEEISRRLDAKIAEVDLAEATGAVSDRCCAGQPWLLTGYEQ